MNIKPVSGVSGLPPPLKVPSDPSLAGPAPQNWAGQANSSAMMLQTGVQLGGSFGETLTPSTVASQGEDDLARV